MGKQRKRKKNRYIEYDYQSVYNQSMDNWDEYFIEDLLKRGKVKCVYATKEIRAGDQLEIEIYPEFTRKEADQNGIRQIDKKKQREAQKLLNDKNSRKTFWRLAEHNFADGDFWITLVYDDTHLPGSLEEATECIGKFLRNVNGKRKRRGLPNAKYLYVTEIVSEDGEAVRVHHHLFMDALLDVNIVEATWKYGRRNECRRIEKDENGIAGAAEYMTKPYRHQGKRKHTKTWGRSKNLENPPEKKHHRTRKKDIDNMVRDNGYIREYVEQSPRYSGYIYSNSSIYLNDHNARFYIRVRMRKGVRDGTEPEHHGGGTQWEEVEQKNLHWRRRKS